MAKRASKVVPAIRVKKPRNPNPVPPPVEYQFKPGASGNPSGRPKGATILSKAYFDALAGLVPNDPQGRTYAELVASGQLIAAAKGSTPAAVEIRKATEGDTSKVFNYDLSKATDEQLQRIANGEDPAHVLATPGGSGTDASPASSGDTD